MTIAPRYAAGKAAARPSPLPLDLIEARAAAFDPLNCLDLGITARRVLFGILTFFNLKRPAAGIWPRRDRLRAEALLNSESSLYRGLNQLEVRGYIVRQQERIGRNGRFHISPIRLTEKALTLLGLNAQARRPQEVIHKDPSAKAEDGLYKERTTQQQSLQRTLQGKPLMKNRANRGVQGRGGVPAALVWLLDLAVSSAGIFKLMGFCKLVGQRLEDVAHVCRPALESLRGRAVFAYLRTAIRDPRDFRHAAQEALVEQAARRAGEAASRFLEYAREKCHGFAVRDARGVLVGRIDASCGAVVGSAGSIPMNLRWALACTEGRFSVRATADDRPGHVF